MFTVSTLSVREAYRNAGFMAAGHPREADDHLATELNFMAALAKRTCDAYEEGDAEATRSQLGLQRSFLKQHLLVWVGKFAEAMSEQGKTGPFYPICAELAALVCRRDFDMVEELLHE